MKDWQFVPSINYTDMKRKVEQMQAQGYELHSWQHVDRGVYFAMMFFKVPYPLVPAGPEI